MSVLVYMDQGVGPLSARLLAKSLRLEGHPFTKATRQTFTETNWEQNTSLLIIPGGRDIYYHQALQGEANRRIRSFVEQGGSYLGLCAGGYYGSSSIEFEKGQALEVISTRELCFFPGVARGSAFGPNLFRYEDESGSCLAALTLTDGNSSSAYFNGGCVFEDAHLFQNVEVIARYKELPDNPAAIIECSVGKGRVILSGVHPEFSLYHLKNVPSVPLALFSNLPERETGRQLLFRHMLKRLLSRF